MTRYTSAFAAALFFLAYSTAAAVTPLPQSEPVDNDRARPAPEMGAGEDALYTGTLRVFMVEPTSRWTDRNGDAYQFGFLDYAMVIDISLQDTSTWTQTITWDGPGNGYQDVTEGNIMAIAALYNSVGEQKDAWPPYGYWFTAYPVDAAAAAAPGNPGQDEASGGYTHTVLVEEGTLTT
jgi:hypothetical protein